MVERHGYAEPVLLAERHAPRHLPAIVEYVAMAQGRALGAARGTRGELDVDGIIRFEGSRHPGKPGRILRIPQGLHGAEVQHTRRLRLPEPDHHLQALQAGADQLPRRRACKLRGQLIEH